MLCFLFCYVMFFVLLRPLQLRSFHLCLFPSLVLLLLNKKPEPTPYYIYNIERQNILYRVCRGRANTVFGFHEYKSTTLSA